VQLSLAVLPFQSRAAASGQAWFAENVGEDLTTNLSRIPGSHVIARVSTQAFSASDADLRKVGRELGVRYVVAGNVDRDGDQVVMNLYLADTGSGAILWTERFSTRLTDLQATERLVADRIANALHVRVVAAEAQRLESHLTSNPAADELALEAWAAWNRGSPADVARAKDLAQKALALDDRSVLAWKTMASWHLRARISQSIPAEMAIAGAEAAARRAMEIDPDHPLVHTVYGGALTLRGRHEEAQKALEHEIATNPSHPVAYYYLGLSHLMRGQSKEAITLYLRAVAISPRDPRLSRFERYLALAYLHNGDLPSALRHARAATQVSMVDRTAWATLASVCALAGDARCADASAGKLRELWPAFTVAQGESEWPPARPEFTTRHANYLKGLALAGLTEKAP
jgi:TolB-like protein/Tfp pilus assembly protein PilF